MTFCLIARALMYPFMKILYKAPSVGAQTAVMLAVEPELAKISGKYFVGCMEKEPSTNAKDAEMGTWLWNHSKEVTHLD